MPAKGLSHEQIFAIEVCARTMSVLSLLGSCFIISTFICFAPFRKPINRLVFYATWGNILANVATLISTSAIPANTGQHSALCEFQGVLIQWFMMADSLWVFCMATNVFLVFWYGYDARQLRHLEKWYMLFAYGVPAIPPISYIILDHHRATRIIGAATLWCWVAKDVDWMRLAFFYGPVWIAVISTLVIYIMTGLKIYRKRALLRPFLRREQDHSTSRDSAIVDESANEPATGTTEGIMVTHEVQHEVHHQNHGSRPVSSEVDGNSFSSTQNLARETHSRKLQQTLPRRARLPLLTRDHHVSYSAQDASHQNTGDGKDAFLTTVIATSQSRDSATLSPRPASAATHHNAASWAYLKVAFLMFAALFVVWIPSTVNRLYQFFHKDQPSYALNIISAIVLPTQGAWNAVIYLYTTRSECRKAYRLLEAKLLHSSPPHTLSDDCPPDDQMMSSGTNCNSEPEVQLLQTWQKSEQSPPSPSKVHRTDSKHDCQPGCFQ